MGIMDKVKSVAKQLQEGISTEVAKFKNRDFLDGAMALCAWVAAADGNVSSEEKSKMIGYVKQSDSLKVFDQNLVIERFTYFADKFEFDASIGQGEALEAIQKAVSKNPSCARTLIQVGIAIGRADGDFDTDEKAVISRACKALELDPSEFDV